jgi:hypothetical protein
MSRKFHINLRVLTVFLIVAPGPSGRRDPFLGGAGAPARFYGRPSRRGAADWPQSTPTFSGAS